MSSIFIRTNLTFGGEGGRVAGWRWVVTFWNNWERPKLTLLSGGHYFQEPLISKLYSSPGCHLSVAFRSYFDFQ